MSTSIRVFAAVIIAATLGACAHDVQNTSGRQYLARGFDSVAEPTRTEPARTAPHGAAPAPTFQSRLRAAAAVEPTLRFPARIGIARLEHGDLSPVPPEEAAAWQKLAEKLGPRFGAFVPISPLIAELVASEERISPRARAQYSSSRVAATIQKIRLGAARQHVDVALVYETIGVSDWSGTPLSMADLSIVGMFVVPSRHVKAEGVANALLLDVRNGYPYGTASARADDQTLVPTIGSDARSGDLRRDVRTAAVVKLAGEVEKMAEALYLRRAAQTR
jgi:hypothetical protein